MNSSYRWIMVALGGLMGCVAIGAMFSLAVFLGPISEATGWSRAAISAAMTIDFLVMGVAGFAWGALSDRFGVRRVVLCGALLLGAGLTLASRATSLLTFQIGYGVLVGLSAGAFFAPTIAAVTAWFDTQRGLAVSLVSAGMGMAPLTISPFAGWLITHYDWRTAMGIIGVGSWCVLIPAALLVRNPPARSATALSSVEGVVPPPRADEMTLKRALLSPHFFVLGGTFFLCCAAHSGPIFHMMSYAQFCGLSTMTAVSIYSVEGLAGLGGRLLFGVAADRLGVKRVLVTGLVAQALTIGTYATIRDAAEFYALAIVFGVAYGGVMPLYAVLAREYFGQKIMGAVFGAATMLSAIGMAFGPVVGGWVFDTWQNYRWLFLGSGAVALGAAAIALTFPRVSRAPAQA
ncbi:MAG: MFS transporter [Opitutus sp.]|nr:MFS transporter [Opitutus sp.]